MYMFVSLLRVKNYGKVTQFEMRKTAKFVWYNLLVFGQISCFFTRDLLVFQILEWHVGVLWFSLIFHCLKAGFVPCPRYRLMVPDFTTRDYGYYRWDPLWPSFSHNPSPAGTETASYLCLTRSISWLLMPWLLSSPGHQQPWYWLYVE